MHQMIANTHDFQVNIRVEKPDGTLRNVALPPKQRGCLKPGERVSEYSLRDYPKLRIAEVPDEGDDAPAQPSLLDPLEGNQNLNNNEVSQ